jgi:RHS repeat-associated protein
LVATTYAYDGDSNRISQNALTYILDTQLGLTKVLGDSDGNRYMHSPRGIHAMYDGTDWSYAVQDGLGSVRMEVGASVSASQNYTPYGEVMDINGSFDSPFGFTGEMLDSNGLQYHRARYYDPSLGAFTALDPWEGKSCTPMTLNGYSWVEGNPVMDAVGELLVTLNGYSYTGGNPVNRVDRNGMCWANSSASPNEQNQCLAAWDSYISIVTDTYTENWPRDVRIMMSQEALYWSALSYSEFVSQWNGPRQPAQTNSGMNLQSAGGSMVLQGLGITQLDSPAPGPADAIGFPWALVGLCVAGFGAIISINHGTIASPQRPTWDFSRDDADENGGDDAIPIPYPFSPDNNSADQINIDTNSAQTFTTADPNSVIAKALIAGYMHNKRVVMTTTATLEFYGQLGTVAGTIERTAANALLLNVQQIPDNPSARVSNLRLTQSVKQNDKIIFGTGDRLGIPTISADMDFVRGALAQGVDLRTQVLTHQPFSFIGV